MEAGYLGVGAMGQPMAHKLLDAGHTLTIYDINETAMRPLLERQARRAASIRNNIGPDPARAPLPPLKHYEPPRGGTTATRA
jgi:6-phosphogluconate dehydrogenase (decarboxylating)